MISALDQREIQRKASTVEYVRKASMQIMNADQLGKQRLGRQASRASDLDVEGTSD